MMHRITLAGLSMMHRITLAGLSMRHRITLPGPSTMHRITLAGLSMTHRIRLARPLHDAPDFSRLWIGAACGGVLRMTLRQAR
jgi:hypothetical protein